MERDRIRLLLTRSGHDRPPPRRIRRHRERVHLQGGPPPDLHGRERAKVWIRDEEREDEAHTSSCAGSMTAAGATRVHAAATALRSTCRVPSRDGEGGRSLACAAGGGGAPRAGLPRVVPRAGPPRRCLCPHRHGHRGHRRSRSREERMRRGGGREWEEEGGSEEPRPSEKEEGGSSGHRVSGAALVSGRGGGAVTLREGGGGKTLRVLYIYEDGYWASPRAGWASIFF